ncbi:ferredoxin [Humibacter sp. BT305]|uniref:ferredoxin n=1 Tax=Cnuibacter physcomitrellae TaxID=1619308 RepID=UPI000E0C59D3|nr:ferredoxin [Cnuibacter physcomitrellae]AXH34101.1 ferredoxin [Humibacter sp. BT305]MCS5497047.1 ferredoxin [Cnuibacter physcomitrellae]
MNRPAPSPTLHLDWTRCQARGACLELLPDLLRPDEDGYPLPLTPPRQRSDIPLDPAQLPAARDAVALCPRLALTLRGQR